MPRVLNRKRSARRREDREARPIGGLPAFLGWCVHFYTALGLVAAALIAVLLVRGGPEAYRNSFLLMLIATLVDASDGTLARRVRIKEVVPSFDGRRLDDLVDFLTYTCLPLLLVWRAELLPNGQEAWLLLPLLASAYGFCQVDIKTKDGYFQGFPSLWNIVALYLYALPIGPWSRLIIINVLALFTFVPSKYLYPSQPGPINRLATWLGIVWGALVVGIVWTLPVTGSLDFSPANRGLTLASIPYVLFYLGVSWAITLRDWSRPRPEIQ